MHNMDSVDLHKLFFNWSEIADDHSDMDVGLPDMEGTVGNRVKRFIRVGYIFGYGWFITI